MSDDNRKSLIEKIKALMSKTVENGCSEAEALAAISKARAMMDVYEISDEELQLTKEEKADISRVDGGSNRIGWWMCGAIAAFTNTKVWGQTRTNDFTFCGLAADRELAVFLANSLTSFVKREMVDFLARTPHHRSETTRLKNGFAMGCCRRISHRLRDLIPAAPTPTAAPSNATALVVVQQAAITEYMVDHGIKLGKGRSSTRQTDRGAYAAGHAAGDRASFGRPVSGRSHTLRLS